MTNPIYYAYDVRCTYRDCRGACSVLNGASLSGIGTLDNTSHPESVVAGIQGRVGGAQYSFVFVYQRTWCAHPRSRRSFRVQATPALSSKQGVDS